jgi:hypothetical protein
MPFVKRDSSGKIIAMYNAPQPGAEEELAPSDDDVLQFLLTNQSADEAKSYLSHSDAEMVRVVEDLINLLIDKNLILLTDLPPVAQKKILTRKHLRNRFHSEQSMLVEDNEIL